MATKQNWMSPTNKIIWRKAFLAKARKVKLNDGRVYTIRYDTMRSKVTDESWEIAIVKGPKVDSASGILRMSKVTREEWIYEDESKTSGMDSLYVGFLESFLSSKEEGINVRVEWEELKERGKETLRKGFNNAIATIGKRAMRVKVIGEGNDVFLVKE